MPQILQTELPPDLGCDPALPGVRPLEDGRWLRIDEAYAEQMAYRRALIEEKGAQVLWQDPDAQDAVTELFSEALAQLPAMGFVPKAGHIGCPDGMSVPIAKGNLLRTLGVCVQEDLCLLQKRGAEHVLTAAVLCFPANWTLAEKAGKPLSRIHRPVAEYDDQMTRRVQRLFDGVRPGKPLWRNNMLRYGDPELHQPRREGESARHKPVAGEDVYLRAERQCIARLPRTQAVVFSIHTYVVRDAAGGGH